MVAIDTRVGTVIAAALLLPGAMLPARAETPPDQGEVALKFLSYRDWQPGFDRIRVLSPAVHVLAPIGSHWSLDGSLVSDSVTGASPRYHSAVSGASRMSERRNAEDVTVTHYADRSAWSVGEAYSDEHDYRSRSASGTYRWSTDDNNRTWNTGLAYTSDAIGSSDDPTLHAHRRTWELTGGVTQAVTAIDLVQLNLGATLGNGDFSDPYKLPDIRPDHRNQYTSLLRWNHRVDDLQGTLRAGWRYYTDTFGIRANTADVAWVQSFGDRFQLTPSLRYTTQRAASFYYDPVYSASLGAPFPPGYDGVHDASADQRLSAFGAVTAGMRMDVKLAQLWKLDVSYERYEQRGSWRLGGNGSPGLAPFSAQWIQLGIARNF